MIAIITTGSLRDFNDWPILATIGCLLNKSQQQKIVTHEDVDFKQLAAGETLYFIQHGTPGAAGVMTAVPVDGDPGMSKVIGKAIKGSTVARCPAKIVLKICNSALDFKDGNTKKKAELKAGLAAASLVRGVSMALAKHSVPATTTVTGYLGPAVVSLADGKTYVAIPGAQAAKAMQLQAELEATHGLPGAIAAALGLPDITKRANAVFKADAVQKFNKDFIAALKAQNLVYPDGKGTVKETAADAQHHLPD